MSLNATGFARSGKRVLFSRFRRRFSAHPYSRKAKPSCPRERPLGDANESIYPSSKKFGWLAFVITPPRCCTLSATIFFCEGNENH